METMIQDRDVIYGAAADLASTNTQAEVNTILNKRIKCYVLEIWIQNALSTDTMHKLEYAKSQYVIFKDEESYLHGTFLWWLVVTDIESNNDILIQLARDNLNELNVKYYDFPVKQMST